MSSFCRITGNARNLPRPCYFPLLPPISPADAKKLCRITGRAQDHHYCPIIAFGKPFRFDGVEGCRITKNEDLCFSRPVFIKYKDNENSFESLTELITNMKDKKKQKVDNKKLFVYRLTDQSNAIILPSELEEAIRTGEIETLSVSKDVEHMNIKIKQGRIVKVKMESVPNSDVDEEIYCYGEGQSKEVLEEQQKILNERNKRKQETMARKKLFEQKEQKAEEDERKDIERPKSNKPLIKFDPKKQKEKLKKMGLLIEEQKDNTAIILPKFDPDSAVNPDEQIRYEKMLEDIANAQRVSVNVMTVLSTNYDFAALGESEKAGFDWDAYQSEEVYEPVEVHVIDISLDELSQSINSKAIDIAASVETIEPPPLVDENIITNIRNIPEEKLTKTENVADSLMGMNSTNKIPNLTDIHKIVSEQNNLDYGYLVKENDTNNSKFVKRENYTIGEELALSGALILIQDEQKFITGQIIHLAQQETFVAGQTFENTFGKRFVPGQTVINENGEITFIHGHSVSTEEGTSFIAGHIIDDKDNKPRFIAGQMVDRGDQKPVFMSGQTILNESGIKFVPGEFITDKEGYKEFVPGMKMPTAEGEKFIPGQVFQTKDGITFTPGQVISTDEGPSFISGKTIKTPEGTSKFIKGEIVQDKDGKMSFKVARTEVGIPDMKEDLVVSKDENVIPNDDLQLVAIVGNNISGFVVKPTNTSNIQAGENLYGDIVENEVSVLFYLNGKLPSDLSEDSKIISGKLTVDETSQRFIPGKIMNTMNGEHFIPGQLVKTTHGEEFIPGQFVETADGPKFVPGHSVMTADGEKFVPGQVIVEEDGPKFVPGQIIQTKNGATFIPGQMMSTYSGKKFVPGQLVETKDGPRFVPGQVIETNEGPKFVSGTIVETDDGLKYLPNTSIPGINIEEAEEDSEISFQGFEISPEEIQLLSHSIANAKPHSPFTKETGLIDSGTLKKLAADTIDIHGRTPEPNIEKKKKKKKKGKITIDALDEEEEKDEVEKEDAGTNKVEILQQLMKVGLTVSSFRKEKELEKLNELLSTIENYNENEAEVEAMKYINSQTPQEDLCEMYIGNDEQLIEDILYEIGDADNLNRNDQVTRIVNDAIKKCVTKKCDEQISELISKISKDPDSLFTDSAAQILLTEAVGIVCVTGDVEVASLLEKFISEPTNPNCLKEDKDVLAVLRQLLVLNRIAERNNDVAKVLQELQDDPEGLKDRNKVRKFIRDAKSLLIREKKSDKSFNIRHVTSSKDIPSEIFEQIRQDRKEAEKFVQKLPDELFKTIIGDERFGGSFMDSLDSSQTGKASKEIEKFKKGMAVVVAKDKVQAVIPRHYARSIYYGIMPYILIDEEGFKFFERGLTGRKLAPSHVIENTWYQPDSYYDKSLLYPQQVTPSGMQYNLIFLGDSYKRKMPSLQYTSLLPTSGPTRISYLESQRRASRDGSITPLRRSSRSTTPTRRFSATGLYDFMPSGSDIYPRRHSSTLGSHNLSRGVSPTETSNPVTTSSYSSYINPYLSDISDTPSITRSGTVGKLLDKYSKVSLAKEFGYQKPIFNSERYKPRSTYEENGEEENEDETNESGYSAADRRYLPPLSLGERSYSSITPEKSDESLGRYHQEKDFDSILTRGKKPLLRPFSDIYENDELESPIERNPLRSALIETAKKNYDAINSNYELTTPPVNTKDNYTSRWRDWKNKFNSINEDEAEQKPTRTSHNRYESVLTGDDDYHPRDTSYRRKTPSYESKILNDDEDDDDDYSGQKYRNALRKKYSKKIEELNKTYKTPSPSRFSRFRKSDVNQDDLEVPATKDARQFASSKDNIGRSKKYGVTNSDELSSTETRKDLKDDQNDIYKNINMGNYASPYGYGQAPYYGHPMGYEQPQPYVPSYGYQPGYRNYGYGSSMHGGGGGGGMNLYSPTTPYVPSTPSRYEAGYGATPSPYSSYGNAPVSSQRQMPYGGVSRRYTMPIHLPSDDDDDDLPSYNPKKGHRELASKIARKYIADSDGENDEQE